jgi:hypothetical protein
VPEVAQGVLYEEALALADKNMALVTMEGVAREPSVLAPKAKEWLDKNRPALLLAQVKAVCVPGGAGSCVEAAKKLAAAHPDSPEDREAAGLMAAEYKRLYPVIKELEALLIQRVMVHDKEKKIELCKQFGGSEEDCAEKHSTSPVPTLSYLSGFWGQKFTGIRDPHYRKRFEARWDKAAQGEYDPETWPRP